MTNLCPDASIQFNIFKCGNNSADYDKKAGDVSGVNIAGSLNEINVIPPLKSQKVECDQKNNLQLILSAITVQPDNPKEQPKTISIAEAE